VLPPPSTVKGWYLRSCARELVFAGKVQFARKMKGRVREGWPRLMFCGRQIKRGLDGVNLYARPDRAYGRVFGVCVCGQSLICPVCAPRVAAFRSGEVQEAFRRATAAGYEARLNTFTIPHEAGTPLAEEIDAFSAAWRSFQRGRDSLVSRRNSLGYHVGRECTWSARSGWHYHHHVLRYDKPDTFSEADARARWQSALEGVGRVSRFSALYAFESGIVGSQSRAAYVAKLATAVEAQANAIGSETASAATKGRNLATLLQQAVNGDAEARAAWLDGCRAITSRKVASVRWSSGLRARLMLGAEKSDADVAAEEVTDTDVFLGSLTAAQWTGIIRYKAEFALLLAANRGRDACNHFLSGLSLGQLNDDAPAVGAASNPPEQETASCSS
jgi:hypothetical protein